MGKRILVCGGRDYVDYHTVFEVLDGQHKAHGIDVIIQGGALGADRFAKYWAQRNGITDLEFRADWKTLGKSAGPIRNRQMLVDGKPDHVIAFPSHGPGTPGMVDLARAFGVAVTEIEE
jgi:YspA, cpYpsA-related SLOG family